MKKYALYLVLLIFLIYEGLAIKHTIQNSKPDLNVVADSFVSRPHLYSPAIRFYSLHYEVVDTIDTTSWLTEHSKLKPIK